MAFHPNLRRSTVAVLWTGLAVAGLSAAGCSTASKALGVSKITPDEFRVVASAPLVVPPDYSLRPPTPGEPRPQELDPEGQAHAALLGQQATAGLDQGETLLIAKAGGDKADPTIRYVVDDEFGDIAYKDKGFADKVMFWKKGDPRSPNANADAAKAADTAAPLNPTAESAKLKTLTGGQEVMITRSKPGKVKLPGL